MRSLWRNILIAVVIIIVLAIGVLFIYRLGTGGTQNALSFAQIYSIMKPSCTDVQHLDIYMYVAEGDTQVRTFTVKNERTGATTTSVSPVTEANGSPKSYERITGKAPDGTMDGDTLTITLQVTQKNSPSQTQHVSYVCNTGHLVGDTDVKTTLVAGQ